MTATSLSTDASLLDGPDLESVYRTVNGVRLHVVAAGDNDAPLIVLLHGAPEFWYCWHRHISSFVDAGYRVLAPDQRGYNLSEKPIGTRPYRLSELSQDIVDLIKTTDRESAHVIGHDWGAAVTWDMALRHPEIVDRIGIINVPHVKVLRETLTSNLQQLRNSWYMFFFQIPRVPEWYAKRNNFDWLEEVMHTANEGTFTDEDIARYRAAWSKERALTGMINWYRALFRFPESPPREYVEAPTLIIWGEQDNYLIPEMAPESVEYCERGRLERFPDATHWVHHEFPDQVADLLINHLTV